MSLRIKLPALVSTDFIFQKNNLVSQATNQPYEEIPVHLSHFRYRDNFGKPLQEKAI